MPSCWGPWAGLSRGAALNIKGVEAVLALRSQYGEPRRELSDAQAYYDLSYFEATVKADRE